MPEAESEPSSEIAPVLSSAVPYRTVNFYGEIMHGIAALLGVNLTDGDLSPEQARVWAQRANSWVRKGWDYWQWRELEITEERALREIYHEVLSYTADTEVYHVDSGQYYRALEDTAAGDLPGESESWAMITLLDRSLSFTQFGKQAIGDVIGLYGYNPRLYRGAWSVDFTRSGAGIDVAISGHTVWITFKPQQPVFTSALYEPAKAYKVNDLVFDPETGDCYRALQDGTGEAISELQHWYRQAFPYLLAEYVQYGVAGDLAEDSPTRRLHHAEAEERLIMEINREGAQGVYNYNLRSRPCWSALGICAALVVPIPTGGCAETIPCI